MAEIKTNGVSGAHAEVHDTEMKAADASAKAKAEALKNEGNKMVALHKFAKALDLYTQAIELDSTSAVFFSNRALCHIKLEAYGSAVEDASKAIDLDRRYVKAYYRRATAYAAMAKLKEAEKEYKQVLVLVPADKESKMKLKEVQKALHQWRFAKAIESEQGKPASETVDEKSIVVDASYDGPRLDAPITLEFVKEMMEYFKKQKRLHRKYVYRIVLDIIKYFQTQPTLVCGDVHGQFYDVLNIFNINGLPGPDNPYLFNGDFVDRGSFSVEVIVTFFAFKLLYPNHFWMSRGNHESLNMNQIYGFKGEVVAKVDAKAFELFSEAFDWLPLAHVINKKVLVVHGGLFSEDGVTLDQIAKITRNCQPPDRELVVRSHEVKEEGYQVEHDGKCITVFSAPNYCDSMGNKGAFIRFGSDMKPVFRSYAAVPHPSIAPMAYASPLFMM